MSASRASSQMTCRQVPHRAQIAPEGVTIAIAVIRPLSWARALNRATRSAQTLGEYAAFSMLQPSTMSPDAVSAAAPTRNPEYGA